MGAAIVQGLAGHQLAGGEQLFSFASLVFLGFSLFPSLFISFFLSGFFFNY